MTKGNPAYSMKPTEQDVRTFYAHLPQGSANALLGRDLILRMELVLEDSTPQDVERALRFLRACAEATVRFQLLICGDDTGYFIPLSRAEAEPSLGRYRKQIYTMLARLRAKKQLIKEIFPISSGTLTVPETTAAVGTPPADTAADGGTTASLVGQDVPLFADYLESDTFTNQVKGGGK